MRRITFDIETSNLFDDVGSNDPVDLDLAVICTHDSVTDEYRSFTQETLRDLWPIIESADALVTWNGDHFDIPLLDKYYSGDLTKIKSIDLMREAHSVLGRRLKLDTVASATLGTAKSANGLEAVEWWRNGEVDKVIKYCIDDVRITKDLCEYALAKGHLKYRDGAELRELKLDTSSWLTPTDSALTYTLPF